MKKIIAGFTIVTIILVTAALSIMIWPERYANESENQSLFNKSAIVSTTPIIDQINNSPVLPSNDQIANSINWSKYPIVSYIGILKSVVVAPNSVINHTFIDVHIRVDINNPDDIPEVYKEMSSIVKAERAIIGPDSSIEIFGYVPSGHIFLVGMMPYSSEIYRRDYIHPVHNLTFSDIDASEVD